MSLWRSAAIERLPELRELIAESENVMSLWIALGSEFEKAYIEPRNESFVERVYSFADWCMQAEQNSDPQRDPRTAVVVAFYEHLPTWAAARDDMPRWFSHDQFVAMKDIFAYHIDPPEFAQLLSHMTKNRHRYQPRTSAASSNR